MSTNEYVRCPDCKQLVDTSNWDCPDCGAAIGELMSLTMYDAVLTSYMGYAFIGAAIFGVAAILTPGLMDSSAPLLAAASAGVGAIGAGFWILGRKMTPRVVHLKTS